MAGLGLKSCVAPLSSSSPISSFADQSYLTFGSAPPPIVYPCESLKDIYIVLYAYSVSIHKVHVSFVSEKSSESTMVDKFMTGALYEACYVV